MATEYRREDIENANERVWRERSTIDPKEWVSVSRLGEACRSCGETESTKTSGCKVSPDGLEWICHRHHTGRRFTEISDEEYEQKKRRQSEFKGRRVRHEPLPDQQLNVALGAILSHLPLSRKHEDALVARGFDRDFARENYFSLPPLGPGDAARSAALAAGSRAANVARNRIPLSRQIERDDECLLIPIISARGQVVSVMTRSAQADGHGRYKNPANHDIRNHFAHPSKLTDERVWITEGAIKAELSARRLGARVIGLNSIGSNHDEAVRDLSFIGAKSVVVAFDVDTNPRAIEDVKKNLAKLTSKLKHAGFDVALAEWAAELGKGLDDLLVAGHAPTLRPVVGARRVGATAKPKADAPESKSGFDESKISSVAKRLLAAAADVLDAQGDAKKALRFRRAATCGRLTDMESCYDCGKPGRAINLVAESPLCPHCSTKYIGMLPVALGQRWPEKAVWTLVRVEAKTPEACRKTQDQIRRKLKKVDPTVSHRIRFWRGPGAVGFASAEPSDAAIIESAGYTPSQVTRDELIKAVQDTLRLRLSYLYELVRHGDVKSLVADPWLNSFVSTTAGKGAKKSLEWDGPKEMRKWYAKQKHGDEEGDTIWKRKSPCCGAWFWYELMDEETGRIVNSRDRKPHSFNEGFMRLQRHLRDVARDAWIPPLSLDEFKAIRAASGRPG